MRAAQMMSTVGELRYQPTQKHLRAFLAGQVVADSDHAVLVWEPRRITPTYGVPVEDVVAALIPAESSQDQEASPSGFGAGPPVLDPRTAFAAHTSPGQVLTVRCGDRLCAESAFRLDDTELGGLILLDFAAFDWLEEDDPIISHPHDPFHRIDVRRSSRHVRFELNGVILADSGRPSLLFEGAFPLTRYYLPRDDIRINLLPSPTRSQCAYKGQATHYTLQIGSDLVPDVAWSYDNPLHDAAEVAGMVAFYQERVDLSLDGQPQDRPRTPWS